MLEKILQNIGLDQKETKVYLASLSLGASSAPEIAKKALLNRVTTYDVLKRLLNKNWVSAIEKKNGNIFTATNPEIVIHNTKVRAMEAEKVIPELLSLSGSIQKKPRISYYQGIQGLKNIYEETLGAKEKILYTITHPENLFETFGEDYFYKYYFKQRVKHGIKIKTLVPNTPMGLKTVAEAKQYLREAKLFDHKKYEIPNEIQIWDNKTALISLKDRMGVVIENEEIANFTKTWWQMVWDKY